VETVSVVVCNFQGAEHLPPCLEAIRAQTLAPDEVIVVDNASTDASCEVVREGFPEARLVQMGENRGPCPARNRGLEEARNPLVLLVDNDAVLAPDALEKLVAGRGDAVLAQPRSVYDAEPERVHYDGGALHYAGLFSLRNFGLPLARAEGRGVVEVGGAVSVVLLAEREALLEAGGFEESYFILFEDLDLSYRLRMAGGRIVSVEDAVARHRAGTEGISYRGPTGYPGRRAFLHSRNRWLYLVRNHAAATLIVSLPGLAAYELVWALFTLVSGNALDYVKGKLDFARRLPAALGQRRGIQARRVVRDRDLLVGGPLTVSPQLRGRTAALRLLDRALAAWWRLVAPFSG
jgi:GT2 family glycosyltransferase